MIIEKIVYNKGKNEGYFIKTRKGFIQVRIMEGEALELKDIKKVSQVEINEVNLKIEEGKSDAKYIG